MKRSSKPRKVGVMPWLIGLLLAGAGLVALFSLGRSGWLRTVTVLPVNALEWSWYEGLFDRRPIGEDGTSLPILRFGGSKEVDGCIDAQEGGAWRTRWFEADGYGDSVEVRNRLVRAGFEVRMKPSALYKEQHRMVLVPASEAALRTKYIEVLAQDIGIATVSNSLVRVLACGRELGLFLLQEGVDDQWSAKRGMRGVSLVRMGMDPTRPDEQFPVIKADSSERVQLRGIIERALSEAAAGRTDMLASLVDEKAAAAWLLLAWIDGRDLRVEPVHFTYQWSNARFSPIYEPPRAGLSHHADDVPLAANLLTPLLQRPDFRARFERLQVEVAAKWPELAQRHASTFTSWAATLRSTTDAPISLAHIANSNAASRLQRYVVTGPGHATFVNGMVLPPVAVRTVEDTMGLAQLAKRHKLLLQGDSIIFPRGKYTIDEDLVFPAGRAVLMLQGARLFMGKGRSLLVKGDLYIRGTLRNPVFIRAQDDAQPFGAIAVLGGSSQQCAISGLYVSGGAGARLAGIECGGMVTVQGASRSIITTSVFQENDAKASLFVDGGELEMRDVRCEGEARQFVHVDHVRAVLYDLVMVGARTNETTGLHIGAGTVAALGGTFTGHNGPAVLADGAGQVLLRNARLSKNSVAVRSVGRAEVYAEGNSIDGNGLAFDAVSEGAGDRLFIYPNILSGNTLDRQGSGIKENTALDESTVSIFGVPLQLPVKEERKGSGRSRRSRTND